jgi:hypothetical protein
MIWCWVYGDVTMFLRLYAEFIVMVDGVLFCWFDGDFVVIYAELMVTLLQFGEFIVISGFDMMI